MHWLFDTVSATAAAAPAEAANTNTLATFLAVLTIFILAVFLGFEVISKVPTTLHTPLMSGTNAIHGIVVAGAMLVAGAIAMSNIGNDLVRTILAFIAVIFGAGNVVGGFVVTDRMLQMFKKRPAPGGKK